LDNTMQALIAVFSDADYVRKHTDFCGRGAVDEMSPTLEEIEKSASAATGADHKTKHLI
jgi:hypothetical protein